jgi:hypothetical protein
VGKVINSDVQGIRLGVAFAFGKYAFEKFRFALEKVAVNTEKDALRLIKLSVSKLRPVLYSQVRSHQEICIPAGNEVLGMFLDL